MTYLQRFKFIHLFLLIFFLSNISLAQQSKDSLLIGMVGDVMFGTVYPSKSYLPPNNNCDKLMQNVKNYLQQPDITFGNFEGTFTTVTHSSKCGKSKNCYTFGMPPSYVKCFKNAGFDVLSIANNHSGDFGSHGRKLTTKTLDNNNIEWAGLTTKPYTIFEKDGVKYGFTAFAPNRGTLQITNIKKAQAIVRHLDSICDIVMVSFHGGAEGRGHQHVTRKTEIFLRQNRGNVYNFAHKVIDAGADIVIGHGPHVTRAVEMYKNRFIAYSLGNFCTYSRINISGVSGMAPIIHVYTDRNGKFLQGKIIPTYQIKYKGVFYDKKKRVISLMQQLTKNDRLNDNISILNNGLILPKVR